MSMSLAEFQKAAYDKAVREAFPYVEGNINDQIGFTATLSNGASPSTGRPLYCIRLHPIQKDGTFALAEVVFVASAEALHYFRRRLSMIAHSRGRIEPPAILDESFTVRVEDVYDKDRVTVFSARTVAGTTDMFEVAVDSVPSDLAKTKSASVILNYVEVMTFCALMQRMGSGLVKV